MKKALGLFLGLLGLTLAIWGIKLLLPDRNSFGNPEQETLVTQCQVKATEATVRLYRGDGGATVAYWYSVTFSERRFFREQQFFYTDGSPSITSIDCRAGEVAVITEEKTFHLPLALIRKELVHQPMGFYRGESQKPFVQPMRVLTIILGLFLEFISALILLESKTYFLPPKN